MQLVYPAAPVDRALTDFNGMSISSGLFYFCLQVRELHSLYFYIYIFCVVYFYKFFLHMVL